MLALTLATAPASAKPTDGPSAKAVGKARGSWQVEQLGGDRYRVSWRSPTRLRLSADRPVIVSRRGLALGVSSVGRDGRTVRADVAATGRPSPADLDVMLSGDRLDVTGNDRRALSQVSGQREAAAPARQLTADPGVPGPYAVVTSDYSRTPTKVAGLDQPIEMVGHIVEPSPAAATGPRPLALFLHGRHDYCYALDGGDPSFQWPCVAGEAEVPSHLGYAYAQRLLASQGYTTVSIRVNGINAQDYLLDDGGAAARAFIVRKHLDYWTTIASAHQVDLSKVVLIGHSRGGEGVDRASIQIPLSAPYRIAGQLLLAPTDFGSQTAPYVPTVTLLPYCDGDVYDLQGQQFTDVGRDLAADDTSLKSSVLVMGANHNFFNTEWTPGTSAAPAVDDWGGDPDAACGTNSPERLTADRQQAVAAAYVSGAVQLFTAGAQQYLPLFDGSAVSVASIGTAQVLSHAIGGGRDVRRPTADMGLSLAQGAVTSFCVNSTDEAYRPRICGTEIGDLITPHWQPRQNPVPRRTFFQMAWTSVGQTGGVVLDRPLDLRGRTLDLRTIVDPRIGDVRVRVRLTDSSGGSAVLTPLGAGRIPRLLTAEFVTKLWAQAVRVDPAGAPGLDLARIARIDLIGDSAKGQVWVADFTGHGAQLSSVPARRLPTVSLGEARVTEGNRPGWTVASVPFTVTGAITEPARIIAVTVSGPASEQRRFGVDLAPGQQSGSIPVGYEADRRDDFDDTFTIAGAWATKNVITDDYLGRLVVHDDDPTPKATIKRLHKTIKEGQSAQWRITLAASVDYEFAVVGQVVDGPRPRLTGNDVPLSWWRTHVFGGKRAQPLSQTDTEVFDVIYPRGRTATLSIPVRKDGRKEGREAVTLAITVLGKRIKSTIYVAASK